MNIAALLTVFGWAFFSFWSSIPAGMALSLSPEVVVLTATLSYGCGVGLVVGVGAPLRARLSRRLAKPDAAVPNPEPSRMQRWVHQAWERFGLFGLALLCPLTVGAQLGAVIGLSLGARPRHLVLLMTLGAGIWAILIVLAIRFGIMSIESL
ncbi:MAG: hypothetical protein DYG88_18190 [Chloroflexi bacterium CFX4]|nr:hypothetical protein [Chloroflexi bacterium CFX4]MDL1924401.1 hypothetical protein [Chloroflexi bacterium CFX3]